MIQGKENNVMPSGGPGDREAGRMPDGWDEWLRQAALTPDESAAMLESMLAECAAASGPAMYTAGDRIRMQAAFAVRSLHPFTERHRIYTGHLSWR